MKTKAFIVFCSPAGSTRHVAVVIERELLRLGADVCVVDIASIVCASALKRPSR